MPRPRSQRVVSSLEDAPEERPVDVPSLPEQAEPVQQTENVIKYMPNTLPREVKLAAVGWRGGCFCCPAQISFGQCISGLWQASKLRGRGADAVVHWGINAQKFLFEAGNRAVFGRSVLLRAGFLDLVPEMLSLDEEVPQSIMLTPQTSFVQAFATPKQLPLTTNPQMVLLGLLSHVAASPDALRAITEAHRLIPALVRSLANTNDDRLRSLALQTLAEWLRDSDASEAPDTASTASTASMDAAAEAESAGAEAEVGYRAVDHAALVHRLLDAGLAAAIVGVMRRSTAAPVLRDAASCLLALLAPGGSGGSGGGSGHGGGRAHGGGGAAAGLTGAELPVGAALEGPLRCRVRAEMLKAGLVAVLLEALSRPPTYWRYWLCVNMGVMGARLLEMQWMLLVVARICLLPEAPTDPGPANAAAASPDARAASHAGSSTRSSSGGAARAANGGKRGAGTNARTEREQERAGPPGLQAQRAMQRQSAVELVLSSPVLQVYADAAVMGRGGGAAESQGDGVEISGGKAQEAPAESAQTEREGAAAPAQEEPAPGAETRGQVSNGGDQSSRSSAGAPAGAAAEAAAPERALKLLSTAIAAASRRECCLPRGVPLAEVPAAERNVTPDWRVVLRDRIRKAAEEARAAAAQASATAAVDVLSAAMAQL